MKPIKTARQARRIADQAADKLPAALQAFADLRRLLGCIDATPGLRNQIEASASRLEAALLAMENTVGVVTPAALFE